VPDCDSPFSCSDMAVFGFCIVQTAVNFNETEKLEFVNFGGFKVAEMGETLRANALDRVRIYR
jgi:hypothetical protein